MELGCCAPSALKIKGQLVFKAQGSLVSDAQQFCEGLTPQQIKLGHLELSEFWKVLLLIIREISVVAI